MYLQEFDLYIITVPRRLLVSVGVGFGCVSVTVGPLMVTVYNKVFNEACVTVVGSSSGHTSHNHDPRMIQTTHLTPS